MSSNWIEDILRFDMRVSLFFSRSQWRVRLYISTIILSNILIRRSRGFPHWIHATMDLIQTQPAHRSLCGVNKYSEKLWLSDRTRTLEPIENGPLLRDEKREAAVTALNSAQNNPIDTEEELERDENWFFTSAGHWKSLWLLRTEREWERKGLGKKELNRQHSITQAS